MPPNGGIQKFLLLHNSALGKKWSVLGGAAAQLQKTRFSGEGTRPVRKGANVAVHGALKPAASSAASLTASSAASFAASPAAASATAVQKTSL